MEEDDKGCPMIRLGVSVSVFSGTGLPWLSRTKAVKRLCVCISCKCLQQHEFTDLSAGVVHHSKSVASEWMHLLRGWQVRGWWGLSSKFYDQLLLLLSMIRLSRCLAQGTLNRSEWLFFKSQVIINTTAHTNSTWASVSDIGDKVIWKYVVDMTASLLVTVLQFCCWLRWRKNFCL